MGKASKSGPKPKTWYGFRSLDEKGFPGSNFTVTKFDDDFQPLEAYTLKVYQGGTTICSCPAGFRTDGCRHGKMASIFAKNQAIDTGHMYCYDTGEWQEPLKLDSMFGGDVL